MRFVVFMTEASGVNVPVNVTPPSLDETTDSVPLGFVRSAFANPVTASLIVIVTDFLE